MTNLNWKADHNMFDMGESSGNLFRADRQPQFRSGEAGYTLIAMLALMTLLALFAMAAAPSIMQQAQREREKEAIFRGEQVADAIRLFYKGKGIRGDAGLPTSIDQLLEGVQLPGRTKKIQILRQSAARDPLSSSGEWTLIAPRTSPLTDFERSVMLYAGLVTPPTPIDRQIADLQIVSAPLLTGLVNTGTTTSAGGGENTSQSSSGPFVGVASRSKRNSVLAYYGIEEHDQWIFTPLFR
jgi:type II secretory pathway pseudopilin PulG